MFTQHADYIVPLLRLLADLPGGAGTREEVLNQFLQRFRSEIPQDHFQLVPSGGEERWSKHLGWTNWDLKNLGMTDAPERGVWRITEAGRDWLSEHPGATHLGGPPQRRKSAATARETRAPKSSGAVAVPSGFTLEKLERLRQVMSVDEFKRDWGADYDRLLAAERVKTTHARKRRLSSGADSPSRSAHPGLPSGARKREPKVRGYLRLDLHLLHPGDTSRRCCPLALRQQG